jgi:hypothetical protein
MPCILAALLLLVTFMLHSQGFHWQDEVPTAPYWRSFQSSTGAGEQDWYTYGGYSLEMDKCFDDLWHYNSMKGTWDLLPSKGSIPGPVFGAIPSLPCSFPAGLAGITKIIHQCQNVMHLHGIPSSDGAW